MCLLACISVVLNANDVAVCFGSTICGRGVLLVCERAAANFAVALSFIHAAHLRERSTSVSQMVEPKQAVTSSA